MLEFIDFGFEVAETEKPLREVLFSRREAACRLALKHLSYEFPHRYLWTLTFPEAMCDWWTGWPFSQTWLKWQRKLGKCVGVKVLELHKEHGIHIHIVTSKRYPVTEVRRIAQQYGFGRVHVLHLHPGDSGEYIAKYLTKDKRKMFGVRRFCVMGAKFGRVRDIQIDSPASRRLKFLWQQCEIEERKPGAFEIRQCLLDSGEVDGENVPMWQPHPTGKKFSGGVSNSLTVSI